MNRLLRRPVLTSSTYKKASADVEIERARAQLIQLREAAEARAIAAQRRPYAD